FIFLTCVFSDGLSSVLLVFFPGALINLELLEGDFFLTIFFVGVAVSMITSFGFLSSRNPSKEGCLITPSFVISRNETSQTIFGLSQVAVASGGFGLNRDGLFTSGSSSNGALLVISGLNIFSISFCCAALNPVPILP